MPAISEDGSTEDDGGCEIDDMLDEALDESGSTAFTQEDGPTPPKAPRQSARAMSPTTSAASWEFETPQHQTRKVKQDA